MLKRSGKILLILGICMAVSICGAQVLPCPGFNPNNNTNLACEIATATRTSGKGSTLGSLSPTLAAQLSQLPIATAVSGSGLTFSRALGVFVASNDSLGTILTQRGDTVGKHRLFVSFNYQRFGFGSIDGIRLKNLPTVNAIAFPGFGRSFTQAETRIDLRVDQFTALATFGLTDKIDVSVIVPFSRVALSTLSAVHQYNVGVDGSLLSDFPLTPSYLPGSAKGIGDITANVKTNLYKGEQASVAVGGEIRLPTGEEENYLGTGAVGIKPYFIYSRRGRLTQNINVGYQWNGSSALFTDPTTGEKQRLPSSLMYSGGVDFRVVKQFTLTGEYLGQMVFDGPRLRLTNVSIPGSADPFKTVETFTGSYLMNNLGAGFKVNPFKGLLISASALIKLDSAGLRSKVVPLLGASYRF